MHDLSFSWYVAQFVGFIALFCGVGAFSQKSDLIFKKRMTLFCLIESVHFFLLTAYSASFGCFVNGLRSFASAKTRSKFVMCFFLVFLWTIGILSIVAFDLNLLSTLYKEQGIIGIVDVLFLKEPIRIFPLLGSTIGTIGLFLLEGIKLRWAILSCSFLWFIHNIGVVSIGPAIMEAIFIFINSMTIRKLYIQSKNAYQSCNSKSN